MITNGQVFAMAGQKSSSADNQSSILFQKPNIRTDVQKCYVSPKQGQKKELKWSFSRHSFYCKYYCW